MQAVVTGYDPELKFWATRYRQGGRTVYSLDLSLAEIASLIPAPDPNVVLPGNRAITLSHAQGFADYLRARPDWIGPALLLRGPSMFDFTALETDGGVPNREYGLMGFPRAAANDLRIVDGQHRILGIHLAIRGIAADLDKARSALASAKKTDAFQAVQDDLKKQVSTILEQRKRFENERVSVQVVVEEDQSAYEQMFADIADNVRPISASVSTRFDKTQVVNRTLRLVMMHPLLLDHLELEKDVLGRNNPKFLSAKQVVDLIRILTVGLDGRINRRRESELSENEMAKKVNAFLDTLVEAFPQLEGVQDGTVQPAALRQSSMLGSPVTLKVLAGTYFDLLACDLSEADILDYFKKLDPYLSTPATDEWVEAVGGDLFFAGALASGSRRQDLKQYKTALVSWALTELPEVLNPKKPKARKVA